MILYVPFYRSTAAISPVVVNTDLVALAVMVVRSRKRRRNAAERHRSSGERKN
jgi:hypothetical protein